MPNKRRRTVVRRRSVEGDWMMDTASAQGSGFGRLDRAANEWTAESLYKTYIADGCAVVRSAVPVDKLETVGRSVNEVFDSKSIRHHFYDEQYREHVGGQATLFELVDTPLLQGFLKEVYAQRAWWPSFATARRVAAPTTTSETYQPPLEFHVDAALHMFEFTVNFWIPFNDCGVDAPSLQLIPVDLHRTREFVGFTGEEHRPGESMRLGHFKPQDEIFTEEKIRHTFGSDSFFRPAMNPGDVIVSSNWVLHASYQTPSMTKGRTSVELRFSNGEIDPATANPS